MAPNLDMRIGNATLRDYLRAIDFVRDDNGWTGSLEVVVSSASSPAARAPVAPATPAAGWVGPGGVFYAGANAPAPSDAAKWANETAKGPAGVAAFSTVLILPF